MRVDCFFYRDHRFFVTKSLFTISLLSPDNVGKNQLIFKESIMSNSITFDIVNVYGHNTHRHN